MDIHELKSNRRILIVGGAEHGKNPALASHEILHSKSLEAALNVIALSRPDLVIYFMKGKTDAIEEHVMTWLIEGFRGKFLLFDPGNRIKDSEILLDSQVIDEYLCGPLSPSRFVSILKSQLTQDIRFAAPRAMTTFDLFRNLFDRSLNAVFFFNQELNRCIAANLRAEQLTGRSLGELRQMGLQDLCLDSDFSPILRAIRRAGHHYYDVRASATLKDLRRRPVPVSISCGAFNFGRRVFVKLEAQAQGEIREAPLAKAAGRAHSHLTISG